MKLKTKLFLSVIVVAISMVVILLSYLGTASQQRKADAALTEAKQMLAEDLGVRPEELTVYWSGEYVADSQYRYRHYQRSSSISDTEYRAHSGSVEPRYGDAVIKDQEVKKLVKKAVRHQNDVESWEKLAFMALFAIFFAIAAIPINVAISLYRWLMAQAE